MSEAKDSLLTINPDIFCGQEVRDWQSFEELLTILPRLKPVVVSRFQDFGSPGIQQIAIGSNIPAYSAWSEAFNRTSDTPPRGFAFAAFPVGKKTLLIYSVHLKSNRGGIEANFGKREGAARQLLAHAAEMERVYGGQENVVIVIAGDFNTDPEDARFAAEQTGPVFRKEFRWAWDGVAPEKRVTLPASGKYPAACFDGFFVKGGKIVSCRAVPDLVGSDHYPVELIISTNE